MEYGASQGQPGRPVAVRRLRQLDVGQKLDVAVALSMREFWTLFRAALVVLVPITVLSFLITVSTLPEDFTTDGFSGTTTTDSSTAGFVAGQLIVQLLQWLALFLAPIVCFRAAAAAYLGEPVGWRESVRSLFRRFWSVLLGVIVISVVLLVAFFVAIFFVAFTAAIFPGLVLVSIPAAFLGWSWVAVIWSLTFQALVLFGPPETVQADLQVQRRGGSAVDWFQVTLGYG
ncbi:MAG TPA: hypothetical protein VHF45_00540, partial [Thermoleophilaceae bacterium]|nr:hypothetical protein [Thermoleophilaceae bacterium]